MVGALEEEKKAKSKGMQKGSEEEPIEAESPFGNKWLGYKEGGDWYIKDPANPSSKFEKNKSEYFTQFFEEQSKDQPEVPIGEQAKADEDEDLELEEKPKTEAETQKSLADPEVQAGIIADYKIGKSTGAIAKSLGFEQNKANRNKIRNILKKAGVYKQKELTPVDSGPDAATVLHKEVKALSGEALYEKIGEQKGSNPGGLYKGKDGVKRYVKFYADPLQASNEMLSNSIYNDLGLNAPVSNLINDNGKIAFASDYIESGTVLKNATLDKGIAKEFMKGFAADVLLKNWDAVGTGMDNVVIKGNKVFRIDNGGSLLYRAKAGKKKDETLKDMSELSMFFNTSKNPYYSKIARAAGYSSIDDMGAELVGQINNIENMVKQNGGWDAYMNKVQPQMDATTKLKVVDMLKTRTESLKGVIKTLGESASKAAEAKKQAHQTALHTPSDYKPGKFTAIAKKYADSIQADTYDTSGTLSKYYKEAGISDKAAKSSLSAVSNWSGSSHSKGAALMKIAAAEYYGKDYTAEPKLKNIVVSNFTDFPGAKAAADQMKEALYAEKEITKEWVTKYGAKHVYRGLHGKIAAEIKSQIQAGAKEIEFKANTLSSWSESHTKAKNFSGGAVVLKLKVDPEHVWSCYKVNKQGLHLQGEKEYIMGVPTETFKISVSDIEVG